jgi:hypothetical protein
VAEQVRSRTIQRLFALSLAVGSLASEHPSSPTG